jgi:hypothetical protein
LTDDLETARGVEQSLLGQLEMERTTMETLCKGLEARLRDADDIQQTLRSDNDRLNRELKVQRLAMEKLNLESHTTLRDTVESLRTSRVVEVNLLAHIQENDKIHAS